MNEDIRRTLDELVVRYELEPELRDVYVEGEFDVDLLHSAIGDKEWNIRIYSIDSINVPRELLDKYKLTSGNKQRVIALAKELECRLNGEFNYLCLTDRDTDFWFGELEFIKNHKWTKYTSLEMHFFEKRYISHFLMRVSRIKPQSFDGLFSDVETILKWRFAFRCADRELGLNLSWVPIDKSIRKTNKGISFNYESYIEKTLNKSSKICRFKEVKESISIWINRFDSDCRQCIRAHDFVELLVWIVLKHSGCKELANDVAIPRFFVNAARNMEEIANEIAV